MKSIKNLVVGTIIAINILVLGWAAASYIDIISDNLSENPQHADWNLFTSVSEYIN